MKPSIFKKSKAAAFFLALVFLLFPAQAADRPNVIIIIADDLGYADVGYQGSPDMVTPNIDSIARNGVQFSAGYVSAPVCGPSRAGLLTGVYQNRFGFEDNPGPYRRSELVKVGIPKTIKTLPERILAAGYRTGMIGKTHTGTDPEFLPNASGFEEFFGFNNGASNYVSDGKFGVKINQTNNPILHDDKPVEESEYITDAFGREAVAFINRHKTEPFFLYVAFNAIHGPMQPKPEDFERFNNIQDPLRRKAVSMNYTLDTNVGRILKALQANGLDKNTLVFFLSDNGGKPNNNGSLNTPLRGEKGQLWDGGIRIPFCAQWPARIAAGGLIDTPIISLDLLPTILAATGAPLSDPVDGVDLIPILTGKTSSLLDRYIFWRFNDAHALRNGEWKYVSSSSKKKPELFHISTDISEANDLSQDKPDVLQQMEKIYNEWNSQLMQKQWGWDKSFPVYDPKFSGEG